jgi:signal transduction histidine kinase
MLWVFYLYRLKLATGQVQERLGARLEERERIARELHDTLLQGFQGLMLRFQAVMKILPDQEPAHRMMEDALDRADEILLEGRQSVRDLREKGNSEGELSETLANLGKELAHERPTLFSIAVVGRARALDPTVFNEICRIGQEALINAFQHAKASKIEVELTYDSARVDLRVRDDGMGIASEVLRTGRLGHWGLSGMRERAHKIGARLHIWSKPNAGTEIELTIAADLAYPQQGKDSLWLYVKRAVMNKKDA